MQEPNFCHGNCKNLADMRQVCQGTVGLCHKIITHQWNNWASFYVVIQIISVTQGTSLLEQSSLAFHCHICCFISQSEVYLVSLWFNCSKTLKFIIYDPYCKMFICIEHGCLLIFLRLNIKQCTQLEKVCDIKINLKKYTA
jgi:hypothetical protein